VDLLPILEELGIEKLREGRKEISGQCPAHRRITGHTDSHPSWSISKETGAHICYSCGWKGGLEALFIEVTGSVPDDLMRDMTVTSLRHAVTPKEEEEEVEPDWDWEHERSVSVPVPAPLREHRFLKAAALDYYEVMWNRERACWMLPFTYPDGTIYGAQYRVHGSELNQPEGVNAKDSLFGIDKVIHWGGAITLVESPLDAVRLWQVGIPAVAAYGAWVSKEQVIMLSRHFNTVVIAMDCDAAGIASTARLQQSFHRITLPYFKFAYATSDPKSELYRKDPGEYPTDEELYLRWNRSFSPSLSAHTSGTLSNSA
jgi:DNA primase